MKTATIALISTFVALSVAPLQITSAGTCVSDVDHMELSSKCCSTNGTTPIVAPDGSTYYIDQRSDPKAGPVWIYEETNSVASLQRGGIARFTGEHDVWVNGKATPAVNITPITIKGPAGPIVIPVDIHQDPIVTPSQHVADVNVYDGCYDVYPNIQADTNIV